MSFQENLRKYRERAGYSQAKEFAEKISVPYQTYLNYENKGTEPKYATLCKIAEVLGVSTDELLGYSLDEFERCKALLPAGHFAFERNEENELIVIRTNRIINGEKFSANFDSELNFINAMHKIEHILHDDFAKKTENLFSDSMYVQIEKRACSEAVEIDNCLAWLEKNGSAPSQELKEWRNRMYKIFQKQKYKQFEKPPTDKRNS